MAERGVHTYREITTQAAAWRGALDAVAARREALTALLETSTGREHLFIGCGSTHYLSLFAGPYFQGVTGRRARGVPSSEVALQTETIVPRGEAPLAVALSRSGETSETIMAVEALRRLGGRALTISCYAQTGLSAASDLTVEIPEGREESFAQTRSWAAMLLASQALAALAAGDAALAAELDRLPGLAEGLIARAHEPARALGQDESVKRITFLGSGPLYGLANEATVKMKEMSLSLAEPYHFMEFRHGPMALVDGEHLVVALLSDRAREYELGVLRDLRERGARIVVIANDTEGIEDCERAFPLVAPVSERARAVLYMPFIQLLGYYRAMGRGLNPDRPRNVTMAIRLSGTRQESA